MVQLTSSRDLAANIGIRFYTPEEYFLGAEPEPFTRDFEPTKFIKSSPDEKTATSSSMKYEKINAQDIVLECGSPGAGKSTFFWKNLEPLGYERVNQDILKTVVLWPGLPARALDFLMLTSCSVKSV